MNATDYRTKKQLNSLVFDLPMSTDGEFFKVRKFPIQQYMVAGKLPTYLSEIARRAALEDTDLVIESEAMSKEEFDEILDFTRKAICFVCVEPKVSEQPITENVLALEEISPEDFAILRDWVLTGGKAADAESFRSESFESFMARNDGGTVRKTTKRVSGNK